MHSPLLSICIPTYNRAAYLGDALESIALQLQDDPKLMDQVEVVVADNASPDNTEAIAKEYEKKFTHFTYIKNPTNVGFDRNVDIAVRNAHGTYAWYLGDDDVIIHGAIAHVVALCEENTYTIISVADAPLTSRPVTEEGVISYTHEDHIVSTSPDESYQKGYLPSALSMLVFKQEDWLRVADLEDHTPGWYYFETILKMAALPGSVVLHVKKPMIKTGQDMRWADGGAGLKIFIDCNRFLRKMIDWGYSREAIEAELASNARRFPHVLLQAKARGLPRSRENKMLIRSYTCNTPLSTRMASDVIFPVPNTLIRLAHSLKKKLP